jgi:hypothetical protein
MFMPETKSDKIWTIAFTIVSLGTMLLMLGFKIKWSKEWRNHVAEAVKHHDVLIGMTETECQLAWGKPGRINRTQESSTETEEWVYDRSRCLCFKDGQLEKIRTSQVNSSPSK